MQPFIRFVYSLLFGGILLLSSGCGLFREDDPDDIPPLAPEEETITLADQRLLEIYERQQEIMTRYGENPDNYSQSTMEMRVNQVVSSYQAFLADNPEDVEAYILFGKFLISVGQWEMAIRQYLIADRLDPTLPVLKQQIGNYLAETGRYMAALPYFLNATDLAPDEALYFYQLGWLLYEYGEQFIGDGFYERTTLESQMMTAFRKAVALDPDHLPYQRTYGEAFYLLEEPNWELAFDVWNQLLPRVEDPLDRQAIHLHRARVLAYLGEKEIALSIMDSIDDPALLTSKNKVLEEIRN